MTIKELSDQFDVLANSYFTSLPHGVTGPSLSFDEYEKSVFLTKAQEEYCTILYNGKNANQDSFERTEEMRRYLSPLIKTVKVNKEDNENKEDTSISEKSVFFKKPSDVWFITFEAVLLEDNIGCLSNSYIPVIPTSQDDFHRIKNNPFRGPGNNRALRLESDNDYLEIICDFPVSLYKVRYIKKPNPIILVDLTNTNLTISGSQISSEGELVDLHDKILEIAVKMAIQSRVGGNSNQQQQEEVNNNN